MGETPGSVVTLLCSGMHFFNAEKRIADCVLEDTAGVAPRRECRKIYLVGIFSGVGRNESRNHDIGRTGTLQLHLGSHCDPFLQKTGV